LVQEFLTKKVNFLFLKKKLKFKFSIFLKNENIHFGTFLGFSLKINKNEFFKVIIEKT